MSDGKLILTIVLCGVCTALMRIAPMLWAQRRRSRSAPAHPALQRLSRSTGLAAIVALLASDLLPRLARSPLQQGPALAVAIAVIALVHRRFGLTPATLLGALVYGVVSTTLPR
ncbi:AzlD domain-containing protein [Amphibiibacter pelophylacis]|uniref:AzlD domain-containing protein n=1 Tax=Amphibiibacter pelophylacis TaxID=1799477 RepID=A0ACC6NYS2_9BURK